MLLCPPRQAARASPSPAAPLPDLAARWVVATGIASAIDETNCVGCPDGTMTIAESICAWPAASAGSAIASATTVGTASAAMIDAADAISIHD